MKLFFTVPLKVGTFILGIIIALCIGTTEVNAAATDNMVGYAWSTNTGWISMNNCTSPTSCTGSDYGVTIAPTGTVRNITGYAWSSNLGWISFNASASDETSLPQKCPKKYNGNCQAYAQFAADGTAKMAGWARVCSVFVSGCTGQVNDQALLGGWDGFISLGDNATYGIAIAKDGTMSGHAWGSDVVGWVDFSQVKLLVVAPAESCLDGIQNQNETAIDSGGVCAPVVTLTATPNLIKVLGNTTSLSWTVTWPAVSGTTPAQSCTASEGWSGSKAVVGGTQSSKGLNVSTPFTLTCTGPGGTGSARVVVTVGPGGGGPVAGMCSIPAVHYLCADKATIATNTNQSGNTYTWSCPGSNGGAAASCSETTTPPGGGGGGMCSNIDDATEKTLGITAASFPPYKLVSNGDGTNKCLCVAGYVLNKNYQCVKITYQEL
jgi:hypothetical protein